VGNWFAHYYYWKQGNSAHKICAWFWFAQWLYSVLYKYSCVIFYLCITIIPILLFLSPVFKFKLCSEETELEKPFPLLSKSFHLTQKSESDPKTYVSYFKFIWVVIYIVVFMW
jgi:hypothetical protein